MNTSLQARANQPWIKSWLHKLHGKDWQAIMRFLMDERILGTKWPTGLHLSRRVSCLSLWPNTSAYSWLLPRGLSFPTYQSLCENHGTHFPGCDSLINWFSTVVKSKVWTQALRLMSYISFLEINVKNLHVASKALQNLLQLCNPTLPFLQPEVCWSVLNNGLLGTRACACQLPWCKYSTLADFKPQTWSQPAYEIPLKAETSDLVSWYSWLQTSLLTPSHPLYYDRKLWVLPPWDTYIHTGCILSLTRITYTHE